MPLSTSVINPGGGVGLSVRDNLRLSLLPLYAHKCMWAHRHTRTHTCNGIMGEIYFFFFSKNLFLSFSYPTVLDNLTGLRKSLCSRINYYSL